MLSDDLRVQMTVPRRLVERRCCLVAFLRGLFLGCGSISAPGAPVHVEFTVEDAGLRRAGARPAGAPRPAVQAGRARAQRRLLQQALADGRRPAGRARRPRGAACAGRSTPCSATVRESANRLANCDEANARRAAAAAERQAAAARRLMASSAWAALPGVAARGRGAAPALPVPEPAGAGRTRAPAAQQVGAQPPPAAAAALADELDA